MAYSNWGAFVYKNGNRMKNKEDVGVFDEDEKDLPSGARIFANLLKNQKEGEQTPWYKHSHHAVLGDGLVRLCVYKCSPELWVLSKDGPKQIELPDVCSNDGSMDRVSYYLSRSDESIPKEETGDYVYSISHYDGNMVEIELKCPNGDEWKTKAGYCYGAGHMDDPE